MNKENVEKLISSFDFFDEDDLPEISCRDGWFNIIWDLCIDLKEINRKRILNMRNDIKAKKLLQNESIKLKVFQIKEKFGTLRFYTNSVSEEELKRIRKAELDSSHVCEFCGKEGKLRKTVWIKTLCDDCYKKFN